MKPNEGFPYLSNTKADIRLLGISPQVNPHTDKVSAQRGMMYSLHLSQAQLTGGCELPRNYSGQESQMGEYSYNHVPRSEVVFPRADIPKFITSRGADYITYNPTNYIITQGKDTGEISYIKADTYTMRADGFGYFNKRNPPPLGFPLDPNVDLTESPAHDGPIYKMLGTNLRVAYMSRCENTEDAFMISESAARKLQPDAFGRIDFDIDADEIPLNLYGDEENYKFMPDVNGNVNDDGILCALRKPTADSIIRDTAEAALLEVQPQHDKIFCVPAGARIVDIDIWINRKAKSKLPDTYRQKVFAQAEKYRAQLLEMYQKIYDTYEQFKEEAQRQGTGTPKFSPTFCTLVRQAIGELLCDGVKLPTIKPPKSGIVPTQKKIPINFIHIVVTYYFPRKINLGFKLTGRYGNKGVISKIIPDKYMPTDEQGRRADLCIDPGSVVNRMNPGQLFEQYFNFGADVLHQHIKNIMDETHDYHEAYKLLLQYCTDINPKYGELIARVHNTEDLIKEFMDEVYRDGIYLQNTPFQKGIDTDMVLALRDKYKFTSSKVTYGVELEDGTWIMKKHKFPVTIGYLYTFLLYKMPVVQGCSYGYVNQFHTPMKVSGAASNQSPVPQTALRFGEDEVRNLLCTTGGKRAARLLGIHANCQDAVNLLAHHLLYDKYPTRLKRIEMSTDEIVKRNSMIKVTEHEFSCLGIDITPDDQDTNEEANDL